jgi:hypothetical protein
MTLEDHICGLFNRLIPQTGNASRQQGSHLVHALSHRHRFRCAAFDFLHWLPVLDVQQSKEKIVLEWRWQYQMEVWDWCGKMLEIASSSENYGALTSNTGWA